MAVRLVQHPVIRPNRCALLPNVAASNERVGFFDFGTDLDLDHVYVSFTAFQQMAARAGWVPRPDGSELVAERARRVEAEEKLAAAERSLAAVEVLRSTGYAPGKRTGRPKGSAKKAPAEAVV